MNLIRSKRCNKHDWHLVWYVKNAYSNDSSVAKLWFKIEVHQCLNCNELSSTVVKRI